MIWHLGSRVSALLDGQLPPGEEEAAWAHVHACHECRDLVEREGWIKTQLGGLSGQALPSTLKGALGDPERCASRLGERPCARRKPAMALFGGGAVGAAALGVVTLMMGPGAPIDQPPTASINRPAVATASTGSERVTQVRLETRHVRAGLAGVRLVP